MNLTLERIKSTEECTLGNLHIEDEVYATIERPWQTNPEGPGGLPRVSCVPLGIYELRPHTSPKFGEVYALHAPALGVYENEVPAGQHYGRSLILIHPANRVTELLGCIAPGMTHGVIGTENVVLDSRVAFAKIRQRLGREETHVLTIREAA